MMSERAAMVELIEPRGPEVPLVYDSPHSGTHYPGDFRHSVDPFLLRGAEDSLVDDLVLGAPDHGVALLRALFARTYLDPNREPDDLDPELVHPDEWDGAIRPGAHSRRGTGLIFRLVGEAVPIYERRLTRAEVLHRIDAAWRAYHELLQKRLDRLRADHGIVWHINWHSMRSVGNRLSPDPGSERPHFVLGDLHGTSCDPRLTGFVARTLREMGYDVGVNQPYAGAYIVRRHGRPADGRHSLQIEINRGLYMNQRTLEPDAGFPRLRDAMTQFTGRLAEWVRGVVAG